MNRLHLFELTDLPWYPELFRRLLTDYLDAVTRLLNAHRAAVPGLGRALRRLKVDQIVDLCSGAGGAPVYLKEALEAELGGPLEVTLTDKFPNQEAIDRLGAVAGVRYVRVGVDARAVPPELAGFRTLFDCFHHFRPEDARQILQDAVDRRVGIAVVEVTERSPRALLSFLLVPFLVLASTPLIRPFRWQRFVLTYVVPVAPVVIFWDGLVSCLRSYTPEELRAMTASLSGPSYSWEMGHARVGGFPVHWMIGYPSETGSASAA